MCVVFLSVDVLLAWHNAVLHWINQKLLFPWENGMHPPSEVVFVKISVHMGKTAKSLLLFLLLVNKQQNFAWQSTSSRSMTEKAWLLCRVSASKTFVFHHLLHCVLTHLNSQFQWSHLRINCCLLSEQVLKVICSWLINATSWKSREQFLLWCTELLIKYILLANESKKKHAEFSLLTHMLCDWLYWHLKWVINSWSSKQAYVHYM